MMASKLEIDDVEWLTDQQANDHSPLFLESLGRLETLLATFRREGIPEDAIANTLLNAHATALAGMAPTDQQVAQVAMIFAEAVIQLRDDDPETKQ
jgi:hypothetical protein